MLLRQRLHRQAECINKSRIKVKSTVGGRIVLGGILTPEK